MARLSPGCALGADRQCEVDHTQQKFLTLLRACWAAASSGPLLRKVDAVRHIEMIPLCHIEVTLPRVLRSGGCTVAVLPVSKRGWQRRYGQPDLECGSGEAGR
jgi:hypothetical protein